MASGTPGADPRPPSVTLAPALQAEISRTVFALDTWLDSMRVPGGYGGPVVHWWRDCLDYTGPGLDWRYEGILIGYLNLWDVTGEALWLAKAQRAGEDLLAGQLPSGHYRNSAFEQNPNSGGTPHEAACDLALLRLALALRAANFTQDWVKFAQAAERNLAAFYVGCLWDATTQTFRDDPSIASFVPNKAATLAEALLALTEVTGDECWATHYALPTLQTVVAHQVPTGPLAGAILQNSLGAQRVHKFFPYYIARCIPGLLAGAAYSGTLSLRQAAQAAAAFVMHTRYPDGSFPQVIYPGGRLNRYPQWVAALGDVLRALDLVQLAAWHPGPTLQWLLAGRRADGGLYTAVGFGRATPGGMPYDPRDTLSVCGWADKAFRYFTRLMPRKN